MCVQTHISFRSAQTTAHVIGMTILLYAHYGPTTRIGKKAFRLTEKLFYIRNETRVNVDCFQFYYMHSMDRLQG